MALPNSSDTVSPKRDPVDVLPTIGSALQLTVTTSSARQQLTAGCRRVSIVANGTAMRYALGDNTVIASGTASHYIAAGERLEFLLDATQTYIAAIGANSAAGGTLEISEIG